MVYNKLHIFAELLSARFNGRFSLAKILFRRLLGSTQKTPVFLIEGTMNNDNSLTTTLFIGREQSAYQFAHLVFPEIRRILFLGKVLFCQVDPSSLPEADIVVIKAKWSKAGRCRECGYLLLPNLSSTLDLRKSIGEIIRGMSRRRRRDVKKLESYCYTYTICRNKEEDFDFFYWKMYLPYIKRRFDKAAQLSNYQTLKACYVRNGGIIFVKKGEKPNTGILFQIRGKTLYALVFGVCEGNQNFVKDLAGQAALFFLIKWAKAKGMKSLNYGRTVPFYNDGIFRFKKEWGMSVEEHADQPFCALKLNPHSKRSPSFLQQNPCIIYDEGAMKGVILLNHKPGEKELQHIRSKHLLQKLNSVIVVCCSPNKSSSKITEVLNTENGFQDVIKPLSNLYLLLQKQGISVDMHEFTFRP